MNKIIICKYVNATNVISNPNKFSKYQLATKQYTQTTELRRILDDAAKELNITHLNDWYKLPTKDYQKIFKSDQFEKEFNASPFLLLSSVYPEHNWESLKFQQQFPKDYWKDTNNLRKFMDQIAKKLNVKQMSDWYNVSSTEFRKLGGTYLLNLKSSFVELLTDAYPEYEWLPWKFRNMPQKYWQDINNVRRFMNWAGKELGVKEMSDWYNIPAMKLSKLGGGNLLKLKSHYELLTETYPEYQWLPWKFGQHPRGYWSDAKNIRKYMDWAGEQLGVKELSDWYNVPYVDFIQIGGKYLVTLKSSYMDLLSAAYPEYNWLPWKFNFFSPKSLVMHPNRRQYYMKWLVEQLKIKEPSDWYKINAEQIIDMRGGILLIENRSLPHLLSQAYPEHKWEDSRFEHPSDIWTDNNLANYFVQWLKKKDEKEISILCQFVKDIGPKGEKVDVLTQALQLAFPQMWNKSSSRNTKKSQFILKECLEKIFNKENTIIMEEYRHPDVVNLELDYFLPQYNIAFEYQGKQHYRTIGFHNRKESIENTRKRDRNKIDTCKDLGITLIEVPYWWDRNLSSLAATIYNSRPDLFDNKPNGIPIALSPPQSNVANDQKTKISKEILMTATNWDYNTMDPKGWFMTEKYDGMRFYWDGTQCYSRQGNKINIPVSLANQLPPVALDGELWTQYGLHQDSVSLMSTQNEEKWNKAKFWIFDAPKLNEPLEERIEFLNQLKLPSFAKVVEFVKCEGKDHLDLFNKTIIEKGGEGVVLREPGSLYKRGRSTNLRKYKPYFDTEVRVLKTQYPQGFTCEQLDGKIVFVDTESSEQAKSIKKGDVITVKHSGMNIHGTLQYPQFFRPRLDVRWNELLNKV